MNLYHPHDLPFRHHQRPECFSALKTALGWKYIWISAELQDSATPIHQPVPVPLSWHPAAELPTLPPQILDEVLASEARTLEGEVPASEARTQEWLGYSAEEIREAQAQHILEGGELPT